MKIADIHAHVFPEKLAEKAAHSIGEFYNMEITRPASLDTLIAEDEKAGISRCVISNSAVTPKQVVNINNYLASAAKTHPSFIAFGSIFPGMEGYEAELARMVEMGIRGVKIHSDFQRLPIDDPSAVGTYRAIARLGLPVLFHMGDTRYDYSSPERLTNLLRQVPDLRVIAAHFGGWSTWERSLAHPQPENVLYDTASTLPLVSRELVLRMLDRFGTERMLFGTDFPMWEPKQQVEQFLSLGLSPAENQRVLYDNFMDLLGLQD